MKLELSPEQPPSVAEAVAELLQTVDSARPAADPWWQAGLDEVLDADYGATTGRPRSTRGAARA
jgi:hypothetical protein